MSNDEQILAALNKLSDLQEQALAIQRQAFESQQEAIANQQKAIKNQVATGRIYRISLVILALLIVAFLFWFFGLWRCETSANRTKHLKWTPAACWLMRTGTPPWALQVCLGLLKWRSKAGLRMFGQVMSRVIRSTPSILDDI